MRLRSIVAAVGVVVVGAGAVQAEIVHFRNPAPGEAGHYDWDTEAEPMYLDITLSAAAQTTLESGSSIAQGIAGFPGGHPDWGVLLGGNGGPGVWASFATTPERDFVRALSYGESFVGLPYESYSLFGLGLPPNVLSEFPEGESRYIGILTADGRFGWVEVEREGLRLRASAWACETEAGVAIFAGQVPTPGAGLALGLGAGCVFGRRRRAVG